MTTQKSTLPDSTIEVPQLERAALFALLEQIHDRGYSVRFEPSRDGSITWPAPRREVVVSRHRDEAGVTRILAHELRHVMQQRAGQAGFLVRYMMPAKRAALEAEAYLWSGWVMGYCEGSSRIRAALFAAAVRDELGERYMIFRERRKRLITSAIMRGWELGARAREVGKRDASDEDGGVHGAT